MLMLPPELHTTLIQIADSGLLSFEPALESKVRKLSYKAEKLWDRVGQSYPNCRSSYGALVARESNPSLARLIEFYRHEHLISRKFGDTLAASEKVIGEIYTLYKQVHSLRAQIEKVYAEGIADVDRLSVPTCPPNPFESLY